MLSCHKRRHKKVDKASLYQDNAEKAEKKTASDSGSLAHLGTKRTGNEIRASVNDDGCKVLTRSESQSEQCCEANNDVVERREAVSQELV